MDIELTKEEQNAINSLHRLAKRWPDSLWLFSGSGGIHVMKKDKNGNKAFLDDAGVDIDYKVDWIDMDSDGGDW